ELRGPTQLQPGSVLQISVAVGPGQHLPGRPPTTVAITEQQQRMRRTHLVPEIALTVLHLGLGHLSVISIRGREVGEDLRDVDTLPVKRMVREGVGVVPGDLLGEEPVEAGPACQLWQSPGVTETVRQPYAV